MGHVGNDFNGRDFIVVYIDHGIEVAMTEMGAQGGFQAAGGRGRNSDSDTHRVFSLRSVY
jgi:hypothetical protein